MKELTGRTRHCIDWRGRLILQVEVRVWTAGYGRPQPGKSYAHFEWRDAKVEDIEPSFARYSVETPDA